MQLSFLASNVDMKILDNLYLVTLTIARKNWRYAVSQKASLQNSIDIPTSTQTANPLVAKQLSNVTLPQLTCSPANSRIIR